jgi:hypothetical protein
MNAWIFIISEILSRLWFWFLSFSPSERVALGSALLVLIGVIGEEVVELSCFEEKKREPLKQSIKRFAIALLLIGLAGDGLGIVMGQAEMKALIKEAGDAKTSAAEAGDKAREAKKNALTALADAGAAAIRSEQAVIDAGNAEDAAGRAETKADAVTKEAVALERRGTLLMEPRIRARFRSHIAAFKGQVFDESTCRMRESEISYFNMAVWSTLEGDGAGWKLAKDEDTGSCQSGVIVLADTRASDHTKRAAQALLDAFIECGLAPRGSRVGTIPAPPPNAGQPGVWYLAASQPDAVVIVIGTHQ